MRLKRLNIDDTSATLSVSFVGARRRAEAPDAYVDGEDISTNVFQKIVISASQVPVEPGVIPTPCNDNEIAESVGTGHM